MYSMPYIVGRMFSNIRDIYNDINAATLTGAIDVVVIEQPDGSFNCSPFHVRFGKLGVLRSREKIVDILINDEPQDICMKLGESGEAFFVEEIPEHERHLEISEELSTSPLPTEHDQSLNFHSFSENNLLSKDMSCVINEDSQTIRRNTDSVLNGLRDSSDFIQETILKKSSDDINDDETISNDLEDFETLGEISDQTIDMYCEQNKTVNNLKKKKRKKGMVRKKKSTTSNDSVTILNSSDLDTRLPKVDPEIHFFSDTEINSNTRPSSPVQSDSELEVSQRRKSLDENDENSWAWGQLPKVQTPKEDNMESSRDKNSSTAGSTKDKKSMLSSVFSFMRHSRKSSNEGLYLADLSSDNIDPAVLAKYFPDRNQPISMLNDDCESGNGPSLPQSPEMMNKDSDLDHEERDKTNFLLDNITLSLCGWQQPPNEHAFLDHIITYSEFMKNPLIIESNDLVVRILDEYYHWSLAAPMILSMLVFKKPLPKSSLVELNNKSDEPELQHHDNDSPKPKQSSSWWSWRRKESNYNASLDSNTSDSHNLQTTAVIEQTETKIIESGEESSHYEVNVDHEKFRKTLRLTSAQIESLHLKQGRNKVVFSVTTAYQGTSRCKCFIYRWRYDDKIVVSDIDGTITKSDVLGHILPIVGKDWAQTGVAQLFTKIKNNGYKLLYLSARAIGQSRLTRDYLQSIKQDDLTLPDGPILLNPTSLLTAFHGEVIEKKPEKFKISCLSDISALFPAESHPFYAGYGNKVNDVWSYRSVSIPIERIFTINHKGELKHELSTTFRSSYTNMSSYVDELFPPLKDNAMDYSHFLYWRDPLPEIDPKQIK